MDRSTLRCWIFSVASANGYSKAKCAQSEFLCNTPWAGDITEFQTNLVPFVRIHFMLSSYVPIIPRYVLIAY